MCFEAVELNTTTDALRINCYKFEKYAKFHFILEMVM